MIEKKTVCQIVDEWLEGKDYFLVEVTVSPDDKIVVEIDHAEGVWIEDCVELSRYITFTMHYASASGIIFHSLMPRVSEEKSTPILYNLRESLAKGKA